MVLALITSMLCHASQIWLALQMTNIWKNKYKTYARLNILFIEFIETFAFSKSCLGDIM